MSAGNPAADPFGRSRQTFELQDCIFGERIHAIRALRSVHMFLSPCFVSHSTAFNLGLFCLFEFIFLGVRTNARSSIQNLLQKFLMQDPMTGLRRKTRLDLVQQYSCILNHIFQTIIPRRWVRIESGVHLLNFRAYSLAKLVMSNDQDMVSKP